MNNSDLFEKFFIRKASSQYIFDLILPDSRKHTTPPPTTLYQVKYAATASENDISIIVRL